MNNNDRVIRAAADRISRLGPLSRDDQENLLGELCGVIDRWKPPCRPRRGIRYQKTDEGLTLFFDYQTDRDAFARMIELMQGSRAPDPRGNDL